MTLCKTMLAHFTIFGQNTLPVWPEGGKETWCMIGNHAIPIITDAYLKGFRNYDANEALNDMIASTDKNREQLEDYREKGFIPTGKDVQSVSKTFWNMPMTMPASRAWPRRWAKMIWPKNMPSVRKTGQCF